MRTVALIAVFVSLALAQVAPCLPSVCLQDGATCPSVDACTACTTAQAACVANATGIAACTCLDTYYNCMTAVSVCIPTLRAFPNCLTSFPNCSAQCTKIAAAPLATTVQFCIPGDSCIAATAKCTKVHKTGACVSSLECGDPTGMSAGMTYTCPIATQTCTVSPNFAYPQDSCLGGQTDCVTGATCTATKCVGLAVNASCTGSFSACNPGLTCAFNPVTFTQTCQPQGILGVNCSATAPCRQGLVCSVGVCSAQYSRAIGSSCTSGAECVTGSYCKMNNTVGVCTASPAATTCLNATDCTPLGTGIGCACNLDGTRTCAVPNTPSAACIAAASAVYTCATTNNCYANTIAPSGFTCLYASCKAQVDAYVACAANPTTTLCTPAVPTSAGGSNVTPATSTNGSAHIVASILLVLAALISF